MQKLTRKEREYQLRRTEMMKAAEKIFSAKGFHHTTMKEIGRESEFAAGTLYHFFKDKTDLYFTLLEEKVKELLRYLQSEVSKTVSSAEKITRLAKAEMAFFEKNKGFSKIFISERNSLEWTAKKDLKERMDKIYQTHLNFIAKIIRDGLRHREFKRLNPKKAAYALVGMLNSSILQRLRDSRAHLVFQSFIPTEMFLKGIQTDTGEKNEKGVN